jgi:hypothetical protein
MKRTTLILEDGCFRGVKDMARKTNQPMSAIVNAFIVEGLRRSKVAAAPSEELPVFRMGRPRVNLGDRDALESRMES